MFVNGLIRFYKLTASGESPWVARRLGRTVLFCGTALPPAACRPSGCRDSSQLTTQYIIIFSAVFAPVACRNTFRTQPGNAALRCITGWVARFARTAKLRPPLPSISKLGGLLPTTEDHHAVVERFQNLGPNKSMDFIKESVSITR